MQANKFQKIVITFLIFSQLAFWPAFALAFVNTAAGSLNPVPINDTGSIAANSLFDGAFTTIKTSYTACTADIKGFEATDNAASLGFSFSAIIGGGGALAAQLQLEVTAYNSYLNTPLLPLCPGMLALMATLDKLTAPNTYTSTLKQQLVTQMRSDIQTYNDKLKTAQARYNVASQSVWKALMITVLINTTKSVADQLVNKLVNNYKIANIKAYTDSLATLAYDNQFIRDNFPGSQDQLMARAILTNPILRSQIQPGIYTEINQNLGFQPMTLSTSDPNYYAKMAAVGATSNNPYYVQTAFVVGVDASHANSVAHAQLQISQGNGYKAPVNCAGSLSQQKQIDTQTKAASDQLANRQALLTNLQQAQALGQNVPVADLARAQADYNSALAAWNNVPYTVSGQNSVSNAAVGGGNNTEGTMAIVMCEAVASPAVLVNQGIDAMFKAVGANISQYNSNNLPGFLSAIGGIATQIGSSMILGGITGNSSTVNEKMAIGQAISATTGATVQTISNAAIASAEGSGVLFNSTQGAGSSATLSWQIFTMKLPTASYVIIVSSTNPVGPNPRQPLTGSMTVSPTSYTNYVLTVYDATGKSLGTATTYISPAATQQSYNSNPNAPAVAGAFTMAAPLDIRGPAVALHPR